MQKEYFMQYKSTSATPKHLGVVIQDDIRCNAVQICLTDTYNNPIDLTEATTIVLKVLKPDNTHIVDSLGENVSIINAKSGMIEVILQDQLVLVEGLHNARIEIYKAAVRMTSAWFTYEVKKDIVRETEIASESQYPILLSLMLQLSEAEDIRKSQENTRLTNESTRVAQETVRQTQESVRQSQEQIRQSQEQVRESQEQKRIDTFNANETNRINTFNTNEDDREHTFTTNESYREHTFITNEGGRIDGFSKAQDWMNQTYQYAEAGREKDFESSLQMAYDAIQFFLLQKGQIQIDYGYFNDRTNKAISIDGGTFGDEVGDVYDFGKFTARDKLVIDGGTF